MDSVFFALKVDDRVYTIMSTTGTYAEYCTAEEQFTFLLHDKLSFDQGAALGIPYMTAYKTYKT